MNGRGNSFILGYKVCKVYGIADLFYAIYVQIYARTHTHAYTHTQNGINSTVTRLSKLNCFDIVALD